MSKKDVIKSAQKQAFELFKQGEIKPLVYHNFNHTEEVAEAAVKIGKASGLSDDELELVELAAWFHDVGYTKQPVDHELIGAERASEFLSKQGYAKDKIEIIQSAIKATKYPQKPQNMLEQVLCDADLAHLGTKKYAEKSQMLHLEAQMLGLMDSSDSGFDMELDFLSKHQYHTEYAQREFSSGKFKNLVNVKKKRDAQREEQDKVLEKVQKEKLKKETPERGIETMFRVSFRNHMALSAIADNKANIMLSINAIIISISLSSLVPSFDSSPQLILPSTLLLFVCIVTIVFATLSTRPKISAGVFTRDDVKLQKTNLLFFGNFHGMPLNEFEWGMDEMMKNRDFLYGSMIKDFYMLGKVLAKKYKYLRICYNIFMYGMIASILTFMITFILHQ